MNEKTAEHLAIALAAGLITAVVTFVTMQYTTPAIKKMIK